MCVILSICICVLYTLYIFAFLYVRYTIVTTKENKTIQEEKNMKSYIVYEIGNGKKYFVKNLGNDKFTAEVLFYYMSTDWNNGHHLTALAMEEEEE